MTEAKPKAERTFSIDLYLTKEELAALEARMKQTGYKNRSLFIREIINKGYIRQTDTSILNKAMSLLSNAANNLNQIARAVNSQQPIFANDIEQILQGYKEVAQEVDSISKVIINPNASYCKRCENHLLID